MLLFPYVFGRSGGEAIDDLECLNACEELNDVIQIIISLNKRIDETGSKLIDLLFDAIKQEKDSKIQNELLNLKRNLYNQRSINTYLPIIEEYFKNTQIGGLFSLYLKDINNKINFIIKGRENFLIEKERARVQLVKLSKKKNIRNGLLFSSEKLSGILEKADPNNFHKLKKKDVFALLKYATRSTTKTTPFSTFNKIFGQKLVKDDLVSVETAEKSFISINNIVLLYIKRLLLYIPDVKEQFPVSINSSLSEPDGFYHFFININNNDHLKKIKKNPVCDYIMETVYKNNKITFDGLSFYVCDQTDEGIPEIKVFLEGLVKEGFLVMNFPVSIYTENWPVQLLYFIKNNIKLKDHKIVNQIVIFLEKFAEIRLALEADMGFLKRKQNLIIAYNTFSELKKIIIEEYPDFPFHNAVKDITITDLFYEDYICKQDSAIQNVDKFVSQIGEVQMLLFLFDEKRYYKELIAQTIKNNFNCATIPLLSFFESFCKNKKEFESKIAKKLQDIIKEPDGTVESIRRAIENNDQFELDLQNVIQNTDNPQIKEGFGMYFQMFEGNMGPICVLNNESYGWGKNISRFLNLFDHKIVTAISSCIHAHHPDCIIADIHDASIHNTNIYPKLTNFLIEISGSEEDDRGYKKIPLSELLININNKDIYLSWKSNKVIPIHFSMENLDRKSSLVKLIDIFSVSAISGLSTIKFVEIYFWSKLLNSKQDIIELPRIVYGVNIVVNRKKWFVKKNVFLSLSNRRIGDEGFFDTYVKMIEWKNRNGIPDEIFIKMNRVPRPPKNLHKPQYINFQNILLIECFFSMIDEADEIIEISEMLPNSTLIKKDMNGEKYVSEYIVNIV